MARENRAASPFPGLARKEPRKRADDTSSRATVFIGLIRRCRGHPVFYPLSRHLDAGLGCRRTGAGHRGTLGFGSTCGDFTCRPTRVLCPLRTATPPGPGMRQDHACASLGRGMSTGYGQCQ